MINARLAARGGVGKADKLYMNTKDKKIIISALALVVCAAVGFCVYRTNVSEPKAAAETTSGRNL